MTNQTTTEPQDYLRSREVMALARISRRTLDRWTSEGILPVVKQPGTQRRYLRSDVMRLLTNAPP